MQEPHLAIGGYMYAGWPAPAHCHATCTTVTHYVLLSRIDSYCEAVWNPIIISRQGTSQQQVEYRAKL